MKNYKIILSFAVLLSCMHTAKAQTINWNNLNADHQHIIYLNVGLEHGVVYGLGYGYHIKSNLFPMMANVEISTPSGEQLLDDLKAKVGVQINWVEVNHFQFSTKVHGVFRRYENDIVRAVNFGSDMAGVIGYYRKGWFAAGEVGFDKAIITHLKHTQSYRDQFPGVSNGWFGPATGGNFYYGAQAGVSIHSQDLFVRAGKLLTQDFKTRPSMPYYAQIGYSVKM